MAAGSRPTKLVLVVVDSLKTEMLEEAVRAGRAPSFAALLERGVFIPDCVSSFPSVTPVASASIATGTGPREHRIPAMNWFHRGEGRYVEYGSSFAATRTFGLVRSLYDTVYNMNLAHLSPVTPTFFERLEDAGFRTACTPFLIFRGRTRHEVALEGLLRRVAQAATFRHAVYGPTELFYGELYASRRVPCAPTLRPGTRDDYSGCVGAELISEDLFDFLLLSLPDNDFHSHARGPDAMADSIEHADRNFGRLVEAAGGIEPFLSDHAVILMADHSQTEVHSPLALIEALSERWEVLGPWSERPDRAELAVSPSARAGSVYLLRPEDRIRQRVLEAIQALPGVDLVARLAGSAGGPPSPPGEVAPPGAEAAVWSARGELRFRPGSQVSDPRGEGWDIDGDPAALGAEIGAGGFDAPDYPDALSRLWSALTAPGAADFLVSAEPGYECVDWGGASHVGGGSHGSLHAGDSLGPLLFVGCGPNQAEEREMWSLQDVAPVVLEHFGIAPAPAEALVE